ncbi:MAG: hypothetical protein ACJ8I9_06985 [Chthoniobacterales bacterium]
MAAGVTMHADDLPKNFAFARYQGMLDKSPFAVASAVAAPAATPAIFKDLYVANAAKGPDGDLVTVASTSDKNFKKYLTTKAPVEGFSISNIEWSDKVGATKVTIGKDGQFATLTFNQSVLSQTIAGAQPQGQQPNALPQPPMPAVPNGGALPGGVPPPNPVPGQIRPAPIPMLPTPPPHVRGVIPRNPTPPSKR